MLKFKSHLLSILNLLLSSILFVSVEIFLRRKINQKVKILKNFYYKKQDEREHIQNKKLLKIINYAYNNIDFYKKFYDEQKVPISKIQTDIKYFNEFPFIDKKILRENYYNFFSKEKKKTFSNCSNGTTGDAVRFFYDTHAADFSSAVTIFCRNQNIKNLHKNIHFASLTEKEAGISKQDLVKSIIFNRENIFYKELSNEALLKIYQNIKDIKPILIHAHPSVMFLLASFISQNFSKKETENLFNIFEPSGEVLQKYMAQKIINVFNCKIHNRYGLSEFGIVAYQFSSEKSHLEVINRCFKVEPHTTNIDIQNSEIVVTGLENFYMPLIKYRTGDLANIYSENSRTFIDDIYGRIHDFFYIDEEKYSTHYLMDILDHKVLNIRNFQIDTSSNSVMLNLIIENIDFLNQTRENCKKYLPKGLNYKFINDNELKLFGNRSKFKHII